MKNKWCTAIAIVFISLLHSIAGKAQVTIGSSTAPHSSAVLDLQSNSRGLLPPRMTSAQRNAIGAPAPGLVVFDTDMNQLFLFNGAQWIPLSGAVSGNSLIASQQSQIPADQKTNGYFGIDVAMGDNYSVVGAPRADSGTTLTAGAVYVYKKATAGGWVQVARLFPSDPQTASYFGGSVAMAGNYIVVGAPVFNVGTTLGAGKTYVFVKGAGDTWTQQTSFTRQGGVASGDLFGYSVAISLASPSGPEIIVGAPSADIAGPDRGAAYIYRFSTGTWNYQATLSPPDLGNSDQFGLKVDIDGDYCAAGAPYQDFLTCNPITGCWTLTDVGAGYIYFYNSGAWGQQQKIRGIIVTGASFAISLSLKGDMLAIGAPFKSSSTSSTPSVILYQRTGVIWNEYNTSISLTNSQGLDISGFFGISVALENDKLIVSMPGGYLTHTGSGVSFTKQGYVFIYKKVSGSNNYYLSKLINDNEPIIPLSSNLFGNAFSIKNGNYVIGIPGKSINGILGIGAIAFGYLE